MAPIAADTALACRCPAQRASTSAGGVTARVSRRTKPAGSTTDHLADTHARGGSARRVWTGSERGLPLAEPTNKQSNRSWRGAAGANSC